MSGFLFHETIFGPVFSRRLGVSLGVNLLPVNAKLCTFNCVYCECGWTKKESNTQLPSRKEVKEQLEKILRERKNTNQGIDTITFAGNGEPTLHPEFSEIIDDTIALRDTYFPTCKVSVLSNATTLHKKNIVSALKKVDQNILKLDAGTEQTYHLINKTNTSKNLHEIVDEIKQFDKNLIIQTLFLRGEIEGRKIDNTTSVEIESWLTFLDEIKPPMVMIYPIARKTPLENIEKISVSELNKIAEKVTQHGINVQVYS